MTTVGFIGSGSIGSTIARLAVAAGHEVVLSNSRGPETLAASVAEQGPRASAARPRRPVTSSWSLCRSARSPTCPPCHWRGRRSSTRATTAPSDGHLPEPDDESLTSSGLLLRYLPDARVVKAFNTIHFEHLRSLARPAGQDAVLAALADATR